MQIPRGRSCRRLAWWRGFAVAAVLLPSAACRDTDAHAARPAVSPTAGKVLYRGKPAGNVHVILHAVGGKDFVEGKGAMYRPNGRTGLDGRFELSTFATNDGAPQGEYLVSVNSFGPPDVTYDPDAPDVDYLKGRYRDPAKANIKVTVKAGDNTLPDIELK